MKSDTDVYIYLREALSHPVRGAWIEITAEYNPIHNFESHPVRGAWIEMVIICCDVVTPMSHPVRGAWIEINMSLDTFTNKMVAPREGCVD